MSVGGIAEIACAAACLIAMWHYTRMRIGEKAREDQDLEIRRLRSHIEVKDARIATLEEYCRQKSEAVISLRNQVDALRRAK